MERNLCGRLWGSGLRLAADDQAGMLRITKVFAKPPAAQAGLSVGLMIQKINGVWVLGKNLPECLGIMGGPVETKVRVEGINPECKDANTIELKRAKFLTSGQ